MLHTKPLYLFDVSPGLIRFNGLFQSADQADSGRSLPGIESRSFEKQPSGELLQITIANDRAHHLAASASQVDPENEKE
jgi:hypothetical protein